MSDETYDTVAWGNDDDGGSAAQQWQRIPGTSQAKLVLCRKLTVAVLELAIWQGGAVGTCPALISSISVSFF